MDFDALYHFLFETLEGVGILIGMFIVVCILACVVMERRTRRRYADRKASKDDWSFFDDDEDNS